MWLLNSADGRFRYSDLKEAPFSVHQTVQVLPLCRPIRAFEQRVLVDTERNFGDKVPLSITAPLLPPEDMARLVSTRWWNGPVPLPLSRRAHQEAFLPIILTK